MLLLKWNSLLYILKKFSHLGEGEGPKVCQSEGGIPKVCETLASDTIFCCNGVIYSTEEILINFHEVGGPRVCEVPSLVTSFHCNGVVFTTEELLPNLVREEVPEFVRC